MRVFYLILFLSVVTAVSILWSNDEAMVQNIFAEQVYAATDDSLVSGGRDGTYDPDGYGSCEFVSTVNNVIKFLIKMTGVFAVIVFLYAGFIMVSSRGDATMLSQTKDLFSNVLIGFVILIAAFLIINTILGILVGGAKGGFTWQKIECTYANKSAQADEVAIKLQEYEGIIVTMESTEDVYPDAILRGLGGGNAYKGGNCSPENLRGLGMTQVQASTFSCIARSESGCNLNADNPKSTARGVFQVLRGYNNPGHNLNFPECTQAAQKAGYDVSGNLNCSRAFRSGYRKPGPNPLADACDVAASNLACNVRAALWLYNDGGAYNPWLGNAYQKHHTAQRACVAKYDPSKINLKKYNF